MSARKALAACAALVLGLFSSTAARAEPAMWVIKDADSTIYLFGAVHMLRPQMDWRTPKITEALKSATELWLEIPNFADQTATAAEFLPAMLQTGISRDRPLSSRLTPQEFAKLSRKAEAVGLNGQALDIFKPWLAAVMISTAPLQKAGYDPAAGVEAILQAQAAAEGDRLLGFETVHQQLTFFADLPEETQLTYLRDALEQGDHTIAEMDALADKWLSGDLAGFERDALDEMRRDTPELYEVLLARRNEAWAEQIHERLKGAGVSFVAVGAAHLLGPDSVQAKLKARGVEAIRY